MARDSILLVEDDLSLLDGMSDYLRLSDYEVSTAEDGLEALEILNSAERPPDLIVSDIMMPQMDGYQLLAAIREREEWMGIPFIFLTAKSTRQDIRSGKQLGADDYIIKPFDVADLVVAIEARLKRKAELERFNESSFAAMKRRILITLNHEFRTPLSYVAAYSDMLLSEGQKLNAEELRTYVEGIKEGSERLMRLVENFLLLVELESGRGQTTYRLRKETIHNPNEFIVRVVERFLPQAEKAGLQLDYIPTPDPLAIIGDYEFLTAALGHLIDNAIKFTKDEGSAVKVSLAEQGGDIAIIVEDDGVGISPDEHERLFELFYQADREKLERPGTGSGLAIVKHIAEIHGGRIEVESEPGKGARFTLYLPTVGKGVNKPGAGDDQPGSS